MKKITMTMMFFGVSIMLIGLPPAFAQPATQDVSNIGWQTTQFEFYNSCADETVSVNGMYKEVVVQTVDGAGGTHWIFNGKVRGTAVGQTTHAGYVYRDSFNAQINEPLGDGSVEKLPAFINLVSLDRNVPDLHIRFMWTFVVNANGDLTAEIFADELFCSPQ
jgi:hypothetical protein